MNRAIKSFPRFDSRCYIILFDLGGYGKALGSMWTDVFSDNEPPSNAKKPVSSGSSYVHTASCRITPASNGKVQAGKTQMAEGR